MQQQQALSPSTRAYAHHYFKSFVQFPCYLPCSKRTILASLIPKPLHLSKKIAPKSKHNTVVLERAFYKSAS